MPRPATAPSRSLGPARAAVLALAALLAGCRAGEPAAPPTAPAATDATTALDAADAAPAAASDMAATLAELVDRADPVFLATLNARRVAWRKGIIPPEAPIERLFGEFELTEELVRAGQLDEAIARLGALRTELMASQVGLETVGPTRDATQRLVAAWLRNVADVALEEGLGDPWAAPGAATIPPDAAGNALQEARRLVRTRSDDLASRWLLHVLTAYVGLPAGDVPEEDRLDPAIPLSEGDLQPFENAAADAGLAGARRQGGAVLDDLDGDGALDLLVSSSGIADPLVLYLNRGDGTFRDATADSGLDGLTGGIGLAQGDYDADGDRDVVVLRGGGLGDAGAFPLSLLRNEGGGRFADVTRAAGLFRLRPGRAAAWGDLDGDGDLDLYVGNQTTVGGAAHANELYLNQGDGTFVERADALGAKALGWTSGVALGDHDDDGDLDLFVTRIDAPTLLLRNAGVDDDGALRPFEDVTASAGLGAPRWASTPFFWDYDDDGHLDLFVGDAGRAQQAFDPLMGDVAADLLGHSATAERPRLYRNRGDGTFEDVTEAAGLWRVLLANGANAVDLDGDGREDLVVATGDADSRSLVPNRAFRNAGDGTFQDVTRAGGFGHLQKGASVAAGDIDGDGDQDVHVGMGGMYEGDRFPALLLRNPGHGARWLTLRLEGTAANRDAIGARVRIDVDGPGGPRSLHRVVSSGGSWGASSLQLEVGLGDAETVRRVVVAWPSATGEQTYEGLAPDATYVLREGEPAARASTPGASGSP